MLPGDRFKSWIDGLALEWRDRLRGWMASWLETGVKLFAEGREPEIIDLTRDTLTKIKDMPDIPAELRALIDKALGTGDIFSVIMGWLMTLLGSIFAIMSLGAPLGRKWEYNQDRALQSYRFDAPLIMSIWNRDRTLYEPLWDNLKDLGWSDYKIGIAKELANILPPLADMVRFADFSAFDPEVIAAWREFYDAPGWIKEPMSLLGITNQEPRDWANKYWFSHWIQPGRFELGDIYRRGLLGKPLVGSGDYGGPEQEGEAERTIKLAYRTMGYSSFWQARLLQLVREIPTRVDVRRWWDMRTIDEEELRSIYQRRGYFGKDLDNYVLWTKVYVALPDLIARVKNGWISPEDAKAELEQTGLKEPRLSELWETKFAIVLPDRVAAERDLTKTDIIKGVKKGVISWSEGIELLQDMGYSEDEADYILTINIAAAAGSPENMQEFRDITQKYRKAVGLPSKPVTEELKKAATELARVTKEVESLREAVEAEGKTLIDPDTAPGTATERLTELQVALHRAEAELARVQTDYNALVAEWRQKEAE